MNRHSPLRLGAFASAALLTACTSSPTLARWPGSAADTLLALPFSESVEGRPLEAYSTGEGAQTVLFVASIHGDESAGTPLLEALVQYLEEHPEELEGRRVVLVPVANPDGVAHHRRTNVHGVDLNRNFPAANRRNDADGGEHALSEPEARYLASIYERISPTRVVSIHQPLACIDWDGPGDELARRMAAVSDLPANKLGARPGSFGSWVGVTLGVPIITLELPGNASSEPEELWERYGEAVLQALRGVEPD